MLKHSRKVGFALLCAVALASPALAGDNVTRGLAADESTDSVLFRGLTATNNYFAARYTCTDPTRSATFLQAAIADCCISGDIWRVTINKGNKSTRLANTANTAQFTAGAPAFAPDVYSPNATIITAVINAQVIPTMGNQTPGGLPAGGTVRITTNGFGALACTLRQVVNGSAAP